MFVNCTTRYLRSLVGASRGVISHWQFAIAFEREISQPAHRGSAAVTEQTALLKTRLKITRRTQITA